MDLRIVKTKKQIKQAFLSLRDKYMPEKIKVKDICEIAMINKTTFYKHYEDSLELAEEIENSSLDALMNGFVQKKSLFDSPKAYVSGLLDATQKQSEELRKIYRGRIGNFSTKLENKLMSWCDLSGKSAEKKIAASFVISGMVHVLAQWLLSEESMRLDMNTLASCMESITANMIPMK